MQLFEEKLVRIFTFTMQLPQNHDMVFGTALLFFATPIMTSKFSHGNGPRSTPRIWTGAKTERERDIIVEDAT